MDTDDAEDFERKTFTNSPKFISNGSFSRYTTKGAIFASRNDRTLWDLPVKPVVERRNADMIDKLTKLDNNYNIDNPSSKKDTL